MRYCPCYWVGEGCLGSLASIALENLGGNIPGLGLRLMILEDSFIHPLLRFFLEGFFRVFIATVIVIQNGLCPNTGYQRF